MKTSLFIAACLLAAAVCSAKSCFNMPGRRKKNRFRNDKWLRKYKTIRVVTSEFHYLPSFLAASGEKYGAVSGTSTVKMLAGSSCAPYAMSASGMFQLENPPDMFMQGDRRFNSHLHEGTCDELAKDNTIVSGLGNHYQHIPICMGYSSVGTAGYADSENCLNSEAPGGQRARKPPFEMWPTYFGVEGDNSTFKVGSLSEEADDLVECPTPCRRNTCTNCQTRNVAWWPLPGVPVSIAVHDTAAVATGSGPLMLCAEITGLATEEPACEAAGIQECRATAEENLKENRFCLYSINPFLSQGSANPCS